MREPVLQIGRLVIAAVLAITLGVMAFSRWVLWPRWEEHRTIQNAIFIATDDVSFDPTQIARDLRQRGYTRSAVLQFTEILRNDSTRTTPTLRANAAWLLGEIGIESRQAVPALIQTLKEEDILLRRRAINALGRIAAESDLSVPALVKALQEDDHGRENAAEALGRFGPEAKAAVPALIVATQDSDPIVRVCAAFSLWKVDRHHATVPTLIGVLSDGMAGMIPRMMAADCLGRIGPEAQEARPILDRLANDDDDENVRWKASEAVKMIEEVRSPEAK